MSDLPPEAIEAAEQALAAPNWAGRDSGLDWGWALQALEAAAPAIRAQATEAERERIVARLDESFFRGVALLNDTFSVATADGEEFHCDSQVELGTAFRLLLEHGHVGLIAAAAIQRGVEPLEFYRTPEYERAKADALASTRSEADDGE